MTLKLAQFCNDPQKYPQNLHTPKNNNFSQNPKNIEIQNFEPKHSPSLRMCEKIRVPPPPPPWDMRMRRLVRVSLLVYKRYG